MPIEFYDLKTRSKVKIDEANIRKVFIDTRGGIRYQLKGRTADNRTVTRLVSRADWDQLKVPEGDFPE